MQLYLPGQTESDEELVLMIQPQTRVKVADNTGAKQLMCIRVLGGGTKPYATVGDVIVASV